MTQEIIESKPKDRKIYQKIIVRHSSGGMGIVGTLTTIFIVLRLVNVIDWSWWWVLSPIWISILLFVAFLIILAIFIKIISNKINKF